VRARGLCNRHYSLWLTHGDPLIEKRPGAPAGPDHHLYKGVDVCYYTAHSRVRRLHGSASEYRCPCGAQAKDWSYDHGDPDEQRNSEGRAYSADPSHYRALCRSCHRRMDNAYRRGLKDAAPA
jgi:hypothetical protein